MAYEQIFRDRVGDYGNGGVVFASPFPDRTGELILQYHETDWEFLKRMASRKHAFLVPETAVTGMKFFFGMPVGKEFDLKEQ